MNKVYYIARPEYSDSIYGDQLPVCLDLAEVERLAREWDMSTDEMLDQMLEADEDDIQQNGVYDSTVKNHVLPVYIVRSDDICADSFDISFHYSLNAAHDSIRGYIAHLTDRENAKTNNYIAGYRIPFTPDQTAKQAFYEWLDDHDSEDPDYVEEYFPEISLTEDAHIAGGSCRLPTEYGEPSIFAMSGSWFEAPAQDTAGNAYVVYWEILDSYDPAEDDESDACDWDRPYCVVRRDPWIDVTDIVRIR
jgi:hypothetical protein